MKYLLKSILLTLISLSLLAAQPLNKAFFTQQIQTLFNEVTITYYTPKKEITDPQKGTTKTIYSSQDSFTRKQTIEFSTDSCSMTVKLSNANTTIQLKDIVDIVFVKNKSPALAPETYPVYLRVMPFEKPVIIYAKSKDKKILKSLSYLSYLCQHKEDSL